MGTRIAGIPVEELKQIVIESYTFTAILKRINIRPIGGNLHTLKQYLNRIGINFDHIPQGPRASAGRCNFRLKQMEPTPNDELFVENSKYRRCTVRRRIIRDKLIDYNCAICHNPPVWMEKELVLRLDHINGLDNDHRLINLRFVCPNCDSQLPTYGSKNTARKIPPYKPPSRKCSCGKDITKWSKTGFCVTCVRPQIPSKEELSELIWKIPTTQISIRYGVSDNAVAKWCRKYHLEKPGPGYWSHLRKKLPAHELNVV